MMHVSQFVCYFGSVHASPHNLNITMFDRETGSETYLFILFTSSTMTSSFFVFFSSFQFLDLVGECDQEH